MLHCNIHISSLPLIRWTSINHQKPLPSLTNGRGALAEWFPGGSHDVSSKAIHHHHHHQPQHPSRAQKRHSETIKVRLGRHLGSIQSIPNWTTIASRYTLSISFLNDGCQELINVYAFHNLSFCWKYAGCRSRQQATNIRITTSGIINTFVAAILILVAIMAISIKTIST